MIPNHDVRAIARIVEEERETLKRGMETTLWPTVTALATSIDFLARTMRVRLVSGDFIDVPLDSFPRLKGASPEQLVKMELLDSGAGIHWPDIDEDLSVSGLLRDFGLAGTQTFLGGWGGAVATPVKKAQYMVHEN